MGRARWVAVFVVLLAAVAAGRGRPPKAMPKSAKRLPKTKLWYLVHTPRDYDPKERYPLVVVAPYRDDQADASFKVWVEFAEQDRIFLAALNFPPGSKEDREQRFCELVETLCRQYETIDRRHLVFVGVEKGAEQVVKFAAAHPRCFAVGIAIAPRRYPDLSKVKPSLRPRLAASTTRLYVTCDPKSKDLQDKLVQARKHLRRFRIGVKAYPAAPEGLGKPSEAEEKVAHRLIREQYSPAKRAEVIAMLRKGGDEERKKEPAKGKPQPPTKRAKGKAKDKPDDVGEGPDPDAVLVQAQEAYEKKDYVAALKLFEQLAKVRPDSEYSRLAERRIKEIESDPSVRRAMADAAAAPRCRSWLNFARSFARNGLKDKAIAQYKKIIAKYPDTSFAEEASRELKALQEQE